ncbi:MAG TPA: ABC transporter permease [Thermoplasmata archaeon]|nr:ABC transporter permease [Thermoplasmata archaeon]
MSARGDAAVKSEAATEDAEEGEIDRAKLIEERIRSAEMLELPPITKRATGARRAWKAALGRSYVRIIGVNREPSWMVFDVALPLLNVAAFVFIYIATVTDPVIERSLVVRVILGGAMVAFWSNMLWSMGANFYFEKEHGNLELYMLAPISRMSILLGMAIGSIFTVTVRSVSTILLGAVVFGVTLNTTRPLELILVFALTMVALYGLGMLFASVFLMWGREAWHTTNLFQEPVFFLSGFYFPVRALGPAVALPAAIVPMTLGIDAMNQLLGGPSASQFGLLPVGVEIAILAVLSVAYVLLARTSLEFMERRGKRMGTLTLQQM